MANNYYSEEQKRALLEGRKAQEQKPKQIRQISAKLDKESLQELKDINDNTLETAVAAIDIKQGLSSFEAKFAEKFSGFREQYEQDNAPLAENLPGFVGPARPPSLTDNSSRNVDNSINVSQENSMKEFFDEHKKAIVDALTLALSVAARTPLPPPDVEPSPQPEEEPTVDRQERKVKDKEKDKKDSKFLSLLGLIKDNTSGLLGKFIGYSLEALAKFAKWTLIIGSLIFAVDVLKNVISKWFEDILNDGEASKRLFGSYFENVKRIVTSIDKGLQNFDMDNLGESLADLILKPMALLGNTIKTAITEGMGNLIYALGEYTKSDTIMGAGRSMKISALRDKQKNGIDISPEDMVMLKEQDLSDQKAKENSKNQQVANEATKQAFSGHMDTGYKPMYEAGGFNDAKKASQKALDDAQKAADAEKAHREELERQIQAMKADPNYLKSETNAENERNRKRVREADRMEALKEKDKPVTEMEINNARDIVNSDNLTDKDRKTMDSLMQSLEEKNNSKRLNEEDAEAFRNLLEKWQDKITAIPDSSASIDKPNQPTQVAQANQSSNNIQMNNKTVHTTVNRSTQRTDHKSLVMLS